MKGKKVARKAKEIKSLPPAKYAAPAEYAAPAVHPAHAHEHSGKAMIAAHAMLFIGVVPFALYAFAEVLKNNLLIYHKLVPEPWNSILAACFGLSGIVFYAWALRVQLSHGVPTPFSMLPFHRLLTAAPYSLSRNPMALGALLFYCGIAFALNSFAFLLIALGFGVIAVLYLKFIEEPAIGKKFGAEYERYRERTPFMLPGI